ncbi:DUF1699 family protein [Candidatus Methanocrinis natronophilus]|uniref:DUF1699 family protein n=1 Tax=Candidatus Methanocrinis natronophilus TaxID=3033396 RepID=A0ABT5XA20_9EURY|nr:DUF1699 family protein [Candidatus Methanocrinis natronophilus]MDF0591518.1 DUF1699 family protein [Candidatus Methanocrinis natronophilus]
MLRTLNSELDLTCLLPGDEEVAISFVPTNRDIYRMLQACHNLKAVYVHPDIFKVMPCVGQTLLYMQEVKLVVDGDLPPTPSQMEDEADLREDETPPQPSTAGVVLVSR